MPSPLNLYCGRQLCLEDFPGVHRRFPWRVALVGVLPSNSDMLRVAAARHHEPHGQVDSEGRIKAGLPGGEACLMIEGWAGVALRLHGTTSPDKDELEINARICPRMVLD